MTAAHLRTTLSHQWYINPQRDNTLISEYFDFNQLPYHSVETWQQIDGGRHSIPHELIHSENCVLVINQDVLDHILSWPVSNQLLRRWLMKNNRLWVCQNTDVFGLLGRSHHRSAIIELDGAIPADSITYFLDTPATDRCWIHLVKNIRFALWPVPCLPLHPMTGMLRIKHSRVGKTQCSKDFMLTMIKKRSRRFRHTLWQQLQSRPDLCQRGILAYHVKQPDLYIGDQPHQHQWPDAHPSMDLYLDSWIEIVPETLYKDFYMITEKTTKPITTKTPFLVVSTAGYLGYLKQLGFRTFDTLIDEKYDLLPRVEDRIARMLDVLQHICHNGAEDFYRASLPILEHNFHNLCAITSRFTHEADLLLRHCVERP